MAIATPQELLERVRLVAERSGAAETEAILERMTTTEVRVRQREVELVDQSSIQGLGLRVLRDRKMGFVYTTDLQPTILDEIVRRTVVLAAEGTPRDENKLPEEPPLSHRDLEIYDEGITRMRTPELIALTRSAEENAFARDKRIETTRDARAGIAVHEVHFVNTYLPYQSYQATATWLSVTAVATEGGAKRQGSFSDRKRIFLDLETSERVGRKAAERAVAKLGAKPLASTKAPVVFDAEAATDWLAGLFGAFSALNVLENRSFLAGRIGQQVASPMVTILDDGLMRRGLGSRPFDGEGVNTRQSVVVGRGVLQHYLHSYVTARRMGEPPTGNALRSYDSLPAVGPTNFYIDRGSTRREKMIADVPKGLYVTGLAGFGIDTVSGEYSQQVEGVWIEKGELTRPVDGVTVGGKLDEMLVGIDAVGNDLEFRGPVAAPSLRFRELTIAGA